MTAPPLPSDIFRTGQVLNNTYEILGVLGRGGTGEVYLARNQVTERDLAIKALNAQFSGNADYVELMKREEQMRNIVHDAVVRYAECSRSGDGHVILVMDYVDGPSLNDLMFDRGLSDRDLLIVAHRVLEGLVATHAQGIVHRDLSPDNIILRGGQPDRATIIDFGIAKDTAAGARTIVGNQFAGKYEYAAPEQLDGHADARSDLYALGASLLAARRRAVPEMESHPTAVVRRKAQPLDTSGIEPPLKDLIDLLSAVDPARRPDSAAAALERLDAWLKPFAARDATPGTKRGRTLALASVAVVAIGGAALWGTGTLDALFVPPLPVADPYTLTASAGEGAAFAGHAPTAEDATLLRDTYERASGVAPPDDALVLAAGLPFDGWTGEVAALMGALDPLEEWVIAVSGDAAEVAGLAPDGATRDAVRAALSATPGSLRLATSLRAGPRLLDPSILGPVLDDHADCGPLQVGSDAEAPYPLDATLRITGDVADGATDAALREAILPRIGDRTLSLETRTLNPELCAIRAVMPTVPAGPVSIWLGRGDSDETVLTGVYRTGENPVAEVQLPETLTGAWLWVMVVDNTGKVFHILPNINREETAIDRLGSVRNGVRTIPVLWPISSLGEDPTRLAVEVTEGDYGKSEIVAIVSTEQLFDMRRPRDESVSSVAEALAEALQGREDVVLGVASRIIDARP
ncbi:serine/threonine protein kinase [Roseivivax isoporae]|uniref:Protein kinase domain-containing protein n=1 Tax=Roseivivax isoporae LMG 25204 TaxID=1449351 RepID=X7FBX3_9RHOB|nr:serine/threonine protein kinase [Roseivivax isoporae]ETX30248.1 hypothetical protein RISW2_15550 [Roseivivax isoporae LMG 25204]